MIQKLDTVAAGLDGRPPLHAFATFRRGRDYGGHRHFPTWGRGPEQFVAGVKLELLRWARERVGVGVDEPLHTFPRHSEW